MIEEMNKYSDHSAESVNFSQKLIEVQES